MKRSQSPGSGQNGSMDDAVLGEARRKEALSQAYVRAVAAAAGYEASERSFDTDGVDMALRAGGEMRPGLDLQLKATVNLEPPRNGLRSFRLKARNYELLRVDSQVPRLLVVLELPRTEDQWLSVSPERLVLRRCAYWLGLHGSPKTESTSAVRVRIPASNRLDVAALRMLMDKSRHGRIP